MTQDNQGNQDNPRERNRWRHDRLKGKLERMHVLQTPTIELNKPLLETLAKWVFRPAELNGEVVSLKALLGIPLSFSQESIAPANPPKS